MNLAKPPAASGLVAWVFQKRDRVREYFDATYQLSKLTVILTYNGKTEKHLVTFSGRNAEVNINLDSLLQ